MKCSACLADNPKSVTTCAGCGLALPGASSAPGDAVAYSPSLAPSTQLQNGAFIISGVLGQGGFGITYQGGEMQLRRVVAIKEFFPYGSHRQGTAVVPSPQIDATNFSRAKQDFVREVTTLARFNHPGIVRVFNVFEENNTAYMVMELLKGQSLQQCLHEKGALSEKNAVRLITHVGEALSVVHRANLLHRDIKPDNIILVGNGTNEERAVLIDFGTAREFTIDKTKAMTSMVTEGYAPLEQYGKQAKFGPYTDIYALGATLYHCLTGKSPTSPMDRLAGIELQSPEEINPHVSRAVSNAVMWGLQIKASDRPQNVREFSDALVSSQPVPHAPSTPATPRTPPLPRTPPVPRTPPAPRTPPIPRTVPVTSLTQESSHAPSVPPIPGTKLCLYCRQAMPTMMLRCPHCGRDKSGTAPADQTEGFREWYRNESVRVGISWGIIALVGFVLVLAVWRGMGSIGLSPKRIDPNDIHATHSRSIEDTNRFKSQSESDASPGCLTNTGPNYPCSDDAKYFIAVNMASGSDLLEVTMNDDWKSLPYDTRLDHVEAMIHRWRKIHAPLQARLRILDSEGSEIGGRSFTGEAWVSK